MTSKIIIGLEDVAPFTSRCMGSDGQTPCEGYKHNPGGKGADSVEFLKQYWRDHITNTNHKVVIEETAR